jgi:hypothetical protein
MPLVNLDIPAGVYSHGVDLDSKGRWLDSSLVRWTNNSPQPVGGWSAFAELDQFVENADFVSSVGWERTPLIGTTLTITGGTATLTSTGGGTAACERDQSDDLEASTSYLVQITIDSLSGTVTPKVGGTIGTGITSTGVHTQTITTGGTLPPSGTADTGFQVGAGESVTVSDFRVYRANRGVHRGSHAWLSLANAPYFASGAYNILLLVDGNKVVYDVTPASFNSGISEASENLGYGGKNYGSAAYGVPRERDYTFAPATNWSLDNWGEDLVALSDADGQLYELDISAFAASPSSTVATLISANASASGQNVPASNESLVVTAERFLFVLGADGNSRKVQWCDRENIYVWNASFTNEAGDFELQTHGRIVAGARVRGRTLICTDNDAWVATYQGPPIVYGFQKIGNSCGLVGKNMLASVGPTAFWMGERNFFVYDGSTARVLPCEVHDKVFTEMNHDRISHGFCVANQKFNEVWWFYPSDAASENDRYVAYDYNENHWMVGELERATGVDTGVFEDPMWVDSLGNLYRHESGYGHAGQSIFLESGPINIADGDNVVRITEMIPEEETQGDVSMTFKTRFYPNGAESSHGPYNPANPTSVRMTGRQFRVRVDGDDETDWRLGDIRLRISGGGRR